MSDGDGATVSKILSRNDTGQSGSHQVGICIPKDPRILAFFPRLDAGRRNPCRMLKFQGPDARVWEFRYIHYNNALFGGTRNEYRLTRISAFMRTYGLKDGDRLSFSRTGVDFSVDIEHSVGPHAQESARLNGARTPKSPWVITLTEEDMRRWKEERQQ